MALKKTSGCMLLLTLVSDQQVKGTNTLSVSTGRAESISSFFIPSSEDMFHSKPTQRVADRSGLNLSGYK